MDLKTPEGLTWESILLECLIRVLERACLRALDLKKGRMRKKRNPSEPRSEHTRTYFVYSEKSHWQENSYYLVFELSTHNLSTV